MGNGLEHNWELGRAALSRRRRSTELRDFSYSEFSVRELFSFAFEINTVAKCMPSVYVYVYVFTFNLTYSLMKELTTILF
jgi:hypothetical protein